jgi:iron(III) transport system ATP-binding protein
MAISDRIAVMKDGVIQHIGTPKDLYQRPANLFVSSFIGRTNILEADATVNSSLMTLHLKDGFTVSLSNVQPEFRQNRKVIVSIRPEEFIISENSDEGLRAVVDSSVFLGLNTHYYVHLDSGQEVEIIQESKIDEIIPEKHTVYLKVKAEKINVFTEDGSRNMLDGVNNDNANSGEA